MLTEIEVASISINERSGESPRVRRLGPTHLGWHTSPECVFIMFCSFDLLSFEFQWFSTLSLACAFVRVGISNLPSFLLSGPQDARTRRPDPLEPFLALLEPLLGLGPLFLDSAVWAPPGAGAQTDPVWAPNSACAQSSVWAPARAGAY